MQRRRHRSWLVACLVVLLVPVVGHAAELTPTEQRWLQGAWPVVVFARESHVPLDIVVQPQPTPGMAPLALAFVNGRCKLVLSMRGNAEAQRTLERIEPELLDAALELMAAHELGHCRRYLDGAWHGLPAGFAATPNLSSTGPSLAMRLAEEDMRATRREEGYGDLVGLAWTQARHPLLYARLHSWLLSERLRDLQQPGSHHDTRTWLKLAADGRALEQGPSSSLFAAALRLWLAGLVEPEN